MEAQLQGDLGDKLYEACKTGDLTSVINSSSLIDHLSTVMAVAASNDHADIVQHCLSKGGYVTDTVMLYVLTSRAFQTYKHLLTSKSVDPDYFIPWYGDVLGNVAQKGEYEWVKLCLENGANPNMNKIDEFKSVIAATAEKGKIEVVKLLLQHGAWLKDSGAIVLAAEAGQGDTVRLLLDKGADINEIGVEDPTDERETAEMGTPLHKAIVGGHEDVVRLLLERGAKIDMKDVQGRTPLALARQENKQVMAHLLAARGAT